MHTEEIILAVVNAVVVQTMTVKSWGALCDAQTYCTGDTSSFLASYVGIVRICTRTARREHFSVELLKDPKTYT